MCFGAGPKITLLRLISGSWNGIPAEVEGGVINHSYTHIYVYMYVFLSLFF